MSSSSRRTWIEIRPRLQSVPVCPSRPPRGGRGLKFIVIDNIAVFISSSSSRRTWIEIARLLRDGCRKESSSSRRTWIEMWKYAATILRGCCRPPRGGRGLKYIERSIRCLDSRRPPRGGRGLKSYADPPPRGFNESSSSRRTWIEMVVDYNRLL